MAEEIIGQFAPAVLGGPYYSFYDSSKPHWWRDWYGDFEQARRPRALRRREYLRGGNIFIRRTVLEEMCGFDPELGVSGEKLAYGEETELQKRLRSRMQRQ